MKNVKEPSLKKVTLEQVLKALGDPVRLSLVKQLIKMPDLERACGTFEYTVTKATFSHHMKILREAGVISVRSEGTRSMTSLREEELNARFPGLIDVLAMEKSSR